MTASRVVLVAIVLGACSSGGTERQAQAGSIQWDDSVAQQVKTQVEQTMNAFAAMDVNTFQAGLAEDVVAYEMDGEGKPVRLGSRAEAVQYADTMFSQLKAAHATLKLDIHSTRCRATSTLAYCTVEFDARASMPDGSAMTQPTWNTVVLAKQSDGWKWVHWHSSLSVAPQTSAPAAR